MACPGSEHLYVYATVTAVYFSFVSADIPAAELQDPFLTPHLPHSINYGNIGFTIGHELSHNFDNEGIRLDANGSETAWISQELLYKYEKKLTCVVNQYSNYTLNIKGKHGQLIKLDGRLTESENIADLIGIQIAFSAYKKVAEQEPQMKLPKLESMSDEKLFFLMFANSWCSSARRKYALRTANIDEHSPPMYRVIGSLSNDPEFSEIFKCPRNSYMNPQNNCNLWN
ncbi:neprilysin-11-like [Calliopsis andreniformis]|uniref:neprilysin-11-like n=1 Tax=Calliopsis andreniformis TaxID=337506 RepID=UPI003FCE2F84